METTNLNIRTDKEVKAAAERIFPILPKDQAEYFRAIWEEFEAEETPEAKFAHVLDNIQPMMLNDASGGKAWREHQCLCGPRYCGDNGA